MRCAKVNNKNGHSGVVRANSDVISEPMLNPEIVADAIVNIANLPLDANVQFMTAMATKCRTSVEAKKRLFPVYLLF